MTTHISNGDHFTTQAVFIEITTFRTLSVVIDGELSTEHVGPVTHSHSHSLLTGTVRLPSTTTGTVRHPPSTTTGTVGHPSATTGTVRHPSTTTGTVGHPRPHLTNSQGRPIKTVPFNVHQFFDFPSHN